MKIDIPFNEKFVENQILNIDSITSLFSNDSKKTITKKLACIKRELKIAWSKGYMMGKSQNK